MGRASFASRNGAGRTRCHVRIHGPSRGHQPGKTHVPATYSAPREGEGGDGLARSFNRIDLPPYVSYEVMVKKVRVAVEQTSGFGDQ